MNNISLLTNFSYLYLMELHELIEFKLKNDLRDYMNELTLMSWEDPRFKELDGKYKYVEEMLKFIGKTKEEIKDREKREKYDRHEYEPEDKIVSIDWYGSDY